MPQMFHELVGDPRDGVPLLLLHGMFASRRMWDLNRETLATRYPLVLVDLPGHGASPPLAQGDDASPEALVAELERIRVELRVDRWSLCGQSFGAGVTLYYALAHPSRVAAQVFTNSRTTFRDAYSPEETEIREGRIARIRAGGREAMRREVFHPRHARRFPEPIKSICRKRPTGSKSRPICGSLERPPRRCRSMGATPSRRCRPCSSTGGTNGLSNPAGRLLRRLGPEWRLPMSTVATR